MRRVILWFGTNFIWVLWAGGCHSLAADLRVDKRIIFRVCHLISILFFLRTCVLELFIFICIKQINLHAAPFFDIISLAKMPLVVNFLRRSCLITLWRPSSYSFLMLNLFDTLFDFSFHLLLVLKSSQLRVKIHKFIVFVELVLQDRFCVVDLPRHLLFHDIVGTEVIVIWVAVELGIKSVVDLETGFDLAI